MEYYVYELRDPRNNDLPFYVGKGKGNRDYSHLKETKESTSNIHKFNKIQAILREGLEVRVVRVAEALNEEDAYQLESQLIQKYGRIKYDPGGILTNVCIDNRPPSAKGRHHSDETKRKMSGPCPSKGRPGEKNGFFGKKHTKEVINHLSVLATKQWSGVSKPESQKQKMKDSFTEERRNHARALALRNMQTTKFKEASRSATITRNKERSKATIKLRLDCYEKALALLIKGTDVKTSTSESKLSYGVVWKLSRNIDYYLGLLQEIYDK